MQECIYRSCSNKVYSNSQYCALHIEKSEFYTDQRSGLLHEFYLSLASFVCKNLSSIGTQNENIELTKKEVESDLRKGILPTFKELKTTAPKFDSIKFPDRKPQYSDQTDYALILNSFSGLWFDHCHFYTSDIGIENSEVFFDNCTFHEYWFLNKLAPLENDRGVIYQYCSFNKVVSYSGYGSKKEKILSPQFSNCCFSKGISLEKLIIHSIFFKDEKNYDEKVIDCSQAEIKINNCNFLDKFSINRCHLNNFICEDSTFKKIEFKENIVDNFKVVNCNFSEIADFYETNFNYFKIYKSIFKKFSGFENCIFGKDENSQIATFKYATFFSFLNFRGAVFNSGVDIENINIEKSANFLGVIILSENTKRESYRIIKDSFDFIGNKLEANYFFSREMNEYRKELKLKKGKLAEKIVFNMNYIISNFGQSYLMPLFYIIVLSIIYGYVINLYDREYFNILLPFQSDFISCTSTTLNNFAKNIMPIKPLLKQGMEFISLLFNIIFSILLWQVIVAVKRHTKR